MTTLAFDGRYLAADRRVCCSHLLRRQTKIFVLSDIVYAACGDIPDITRIVEWLAAGYEPKDRPTLREGGGWGIAVRKSDISVRYHVQGQNPVLHPIEEPFSADGSGRDFALAAMALGKNARDAVELAMRFDVNTGDGVDVYDMKEARFTEVGDARLLVPRVGRIDIHASAEPHVRCDDVYCCGCECNVCKRAWNAAGRPNPSRCPQHSTVA